MEDDHTTYGVSHGIPWQDELIIARKKQEEEDKRRREEEEARQKAYEDAKAHAEKAHAEKAQ